PSAPMAKEAPPPQLGRSHLARAAPASARCNGRLSTARSTCAEHELVAGARTPRYRRESMSAPKKRVSQPSMAVPPDARRAMPAARIHAHGEGRLDLVLDFVHFVAKPMPLSLLLDEGPRRIAEIVGADVASLYLIEGEGGELVLRGNVGFPQEARGVVRLAVGEGITGMAVEHMRPISVCQAPEHERYR